MSDGGAPGGSVIMGVVPGERFVDEEEPEVKGDGDRNEPTVFELIEPFDVSVEELGVVAVVPCTRSGGSNREYEG